MGRRKERRLAAMSAAGRRVKLDLFVEPSGQQPQNPLVLLEQYSDEDSEDDSSKQLNQAVSQGSSVCADKEAIVYACEETRHIENNGGKEHNQTMEQLLIKDGSSQEPSTKHEEANVSGVNSHDLHQKQTNIRTEETTYDATAPDDNLIGDVNSGWKMVLHEESNQYYYWNTVTGETSWEVPGVFAQETVSSIERGNGDVKEKVDASVELDKSNTPLVMGEDYISRKDSFESNFHCQNSEGVVQDTKMDDSHEGFKGDTINGDECKKEANKSDDSSLLGGCSVEIRTGIELPSHLIKLCEGLLERLNSMKCFNCHAEDKDFKLKCMLEIEIRLADIKALAAHGSSLLPFWLHSEDQLKRLEALVEDAMNHPSRSPSGLEAEVDSSGKKELAGLEHQAVPIARSSNFEAHGVAPTSTEHLTSMCYTSSYPVDDVGRKSEMIVTLTESVLPPGTVHSDEDEDMDVDMEVEDTSTVKPPHANATGAYHHVSPELSSLQTNQALQESSVAVNGPPTEEWIPPPPPDSEPFPPPPPDDEPFPPPPPDEPPETSFPPPAHLGSVQPFSYPEQYASSYPGAGIEYYGQTNLEVSTGTLYTHPDGGVQLPIPQLPHYYEAVPSIYGVTPLGVTAIDSTAYYAPQNASLSHVPLITGASEASIAHSEPAPENLDSAKQGNLDSLLTHSSIVGESGNGTGKSTVEGSEAQPAVGAPSTSMANGVSVTSTSETISSASAAAAAAAAAASKPQSKVTRNKKRNVATVSSLRSNKKVSKLVDKWKAAKEELQEEEEEPENAYEMLERKRQREIEEWRAQQIASGEAKDNANFQPLGGDWRERVKRRRAERMKEKKQSPSNIASSPDINQQQVDLVEMSKGLPSGWQVYWDDSSKQVYYGNVLTSETTWTRPAD
ncbi:uncharacterized protein LOC127249570 isoform X2 [Andrographis paniculata]|uniref:uncharacterized protein LOC127249570 isoform X2 n=1 Tax=Andrographis paniculata TaxID=175694 RepID=UPI0021E79689|nr:uncharacterized protein LOC127249570 isoform X2 [Andrographis paniculata]